MGCRRQPARAGTLFHVHEHLLVEREQAPACVPQLAKLHREVIVRRRVVRALEVLMTPAETEVGPAGTEHRQKEGQNTADATDFLSRAIFRGRDSKEVTEKFVSAVD